MDERTAIRIRARACALIVGGLVATSGALLLPAGASAKAGAITGTVKKEGAVALANTRVCAFGSETSECKDTNGSGEYELPGLTAGKKYTVAFTGEECPVSEEECSREYITEYWNGVKSAESATLVLTGEENIDAQLETGASISGTVTRASNGTPIGLTRVCAFSASVQNFGEFFEELFRLAVYCVVSEPNGSYTIAGLSGGEYKVGFTGEVCTTRACTELNESEIFSTQYFSGQQTIEGANHVNVLAHGTASSVNGALVEAPTVTTTTTTATSASAATGATGATGPAGVTGSTGPTGPSGATGVPGEAGHAGATGATGQTGTAGASGVAGATGATGPTGATGLTGVTGAAGATGVTGATGASGKTGATGPTGATGLAGLQRVYSATSAGGSKSAMLSLSAPPGQDYVASFDAQATVLSIRPLTCTLKFGTVVEQTMAFPFDTSPVEVYLQGDGTLVSGTIAVSCTSEGGGDAVSNMSLIASVASAIN